MIIFDAIFPCHRKQMKLLLNLSQTFSFWMSMSSHSEGMVNDGGKHSTISFSFCWKDWDKECFNQPQHTSIFWTTLDPRFYHYVFMAFWLQVTRSSGRQRYCFYKHTKIHLFHGTTQNVRQLLNWKPLRVKMGAPIGKSVVLGHRGRMKHPPDCVKVWLLFRANEYWEWQTGHTVTWIHNDPLDLFSSWSIRDKMVRNSPQGWAPFPLWGGDVAISGQMWSDEIRSLDTPSGRFPYLDAYCSNRSHYH